MIILLSPSKTINPKPTPEWLTPTDLLHTVAATKLVNRTRKLGRNLQKTLGVSKKIADENRIRFDEWTANPTAEQGHPAGWTYRGETYFGLSIEQFSESSVGFAQTHLYIVSGLYGLLRPLDMIMPYRLEMSTRLKGPWGKNLYEFWGNTLANHMMDLSADQPEFILNCASNEYSKAIQKHLPEDVLFITPKFLHNGKSKMAFAKYSRGLMARWAIEHQITNPSDIRNFTVEGYVYDTARSTPQQPVFTAPADFTIKGRFTKL